MYTVNHQYRVAFFTEFLRKTRELRDMLECDFLGCKTNWALFVSAALSERVGKYLKPFPPQFKSEMFGVRIQQLIAVIKRTPNLECLLQHLRNNKFKKDDFEVVALLHWLLKARGRNLYLLHYGDVYKVNNFLVDKPPTYIFEVNRPINSVENANYKSQSEGQQIRVAYFGGGLDRFYFLINNGFPSFEPVLLTANLSIALQHSNMETTSFDELRTTCVAVCEYIDDPAHVQHKDMYDANYNVPFDAIVVNKKDLVRIRYLFTYVTEYKVCEQWKRIKNMLITTFFWIVITAYVASYIY